MANYKYAIEFAILIFPLIAFLMTLSYMIVQYFKYGSIPFLRTLIVYSFVLYLITAYFMVILPLPSIDYVLQLNTPLVQLIPFRFIGDLIMESKFVISDFSTYLVALKQPVFYVNIFNIILTVPFGVYLRYYFKRKWWGVLIFTFLLSLFFEITQFTGLYGIYPRPYRLFDIDDLILNSAGGMLGYLLTPLFLFLFPSKEKVDEIAYERGKKVSFSRRCVAYLIDCFVYNFFVVIIVLVFNVKFSIELYSLFFLLYFLINVLLFDRKTIGKKIVKIMIVNQDGSRAKIYQVFARYILRYIIYFKIYDIINWSRKIQESNEIISLMSVFLCLFVFLIYLKTFFDILTKKEQYVYEVLSKTKNISIINYKNNL